MYVICRKCGKEAQEISRQTEWAYQYHPACRPWDTKNQEREDKKQAFFAERKRERERRKKTMTSHERFAKYLHELLDGQTAVRIENPPYMPLSIEKLPSTFGSYHISLTHYGEQNGDLMRDPEMVFCVYSHDIPVAYPISYRQDDLGIYQELYADFEGGKPANFRPWLVPEFRQFANLWFRNLKHQGFFKKSTKRTPLAA